MAELAPQAHYVRGTGRDTQFEVVYPPGVLPEQVAPSVLRLGMQRGIRIKTIYRTIDPSNIPVTMLQVAADPDAVLRAALLIKDVTRLALPISIRSVRVGIRPCVCGEVGVTVTSLEFVKGFRPANDDAFRERLQQAISTLQILVLLGARPAAPHTALALAIQGLLPRMRAYAMKIQIFVRAHHGPCPHRR